MQSGYFLTKQGGSIDAYSLTLEALTATPKPHRIAIFRESVEF